MMNKIIIKNFILPDLFIEIYVFYESDVQKLATEVSKLLSFYFEKRNVYISDFVLKGKKIIIHVDCYNEIIDMNNFVFYLNTNIDFSVIDKISIS